MQPEHWNIVVALCITALALIAYFIPAVVARERRHPQRTSIGLLNLFLGWTFLGWVVALVWAASHIEHHEPHASKFRRRRNSN